MPKYNVDIKLSGLAGTDFVSHHRMWQTSIYDAMVKAIEATKNSIIKEAPLGVTEKLKKGFEYKIRQVGIKCTGTIYSIKSIKDYVFPVEFGRRARKKWPPKGVLISWMMLKFGLNLKEATKKEWLLRRHIHKHGTKPTFFFAIGIVNSYEYVMSLFKGTIRDINVRTPNVRK